MSLNRLYKVVKEQEVCVAFCRWHKMAIGWLAGRPAGLVFVPGAVLCRAGVEKIF